MKLMTLFPIVFAVGCVSLEEASTCVDLRNEPLASDEATEVLGGESLDDWLAANQQGWSWEVRWDAADAPESETLTLEILDTGDATVLEQDYERPGAPEGLGGCVLEPSVVVPVQMRLEGSVTGGGEAWGELVLQGGELATAQVRDLVVEVDSSWEPAGDDCAVESWQLSVDADATLAAPSGSLGGAGATDDQSCTAALATWSVAD